MTKSIIELEVELKKTDSTLMWYYAVVIPDDIAEPFIEGKDRRVICTLPNGESFHCALNSSNELGGYSILINKERRKKLGLILGERFKIKLEKDTSTYGTPMSDEFAAVMDQDEEGSRLFHELTPGNQRSLIYFSDNVKSSEIKIRRALVVMEHLKEEKGKLDYKRLGAMIKEANQNAKLK